MEADKKHFLPNRRQFIRQLFPSCAFCGIVFPQLMSNHSLFISAEEPEKHKFSNPSGLTWEQVFDMVFKHWYIPAMKNLMDQIGKEEFLDLLKKSSERLQKENTFFERNFKERTMQVWMDYIKKVNENWSDWLTLEVVEEGEDVFEVKFKECIWAKTFREANASEIGFAGVCFQDYGMTRKFNPEMSLVRKKTLMEGDDCCNFKWKMKTS